VPVLTVIDPVIYLSQRVERIDHRGGGPMKAVHAGFALAAGLALTDLDDIDLWNRYFALGGAHSRPELVRYLNGHGAWTAHEHNVAAHAVNEYTSDRGMDHPVGYADEV
jgi:hypothetical protein